MQQSIFRIAAIDIWECSYKLSEMQQSISLNAAIKYIGNEAINIQDCSNRYLGMQ